MKEWNKGNSGKDLKDLKDFNGEICTAEEYNKKYCIVANSTKKKRKKPHVRNDGEIFWNKMSEEDRKRFAESYMEFLVYRECRC